MIFLGVPNLEHNKCAPCESNLWFFFVSHKNLSAPFHSHSRSGKWFIFMGMQNICLLYFYKPFIWMIFRTYWAVMKLRNWTLR